MRILIVGQGAREHSLAYALSNHEVHYTGTQNLGMDEISTFHSSSSQDEIMGIATHIKPDLVVIGSETWLVNGLSDNLRNEGIKVFGPNANGAQLEGSKSFGKEIFQKQGIPTANYKFFTSHIDEQEYKNIFESLGLGEKPIVMKKDGLAAGKGVAIVHNHEEAMSWIKDNGKDSSFLVEEFLVGKEASFFAFCDGENLLPLGSAKDYKRAYDQDEGPNTGGMGAVSPAPIPIAFTTFAKRQEEGKTNQSYLHDKILGQVMDKIFEPTLDYLKKAGILYQGLLYCGAMLTKEGAKVLEYNCRFGDPECEALALRFREDFGDYLRACSDLGALKNLDWKLSDKESACVVIANKGYPNHVTKGNEIHGLDKVVNYGKDLENNSPQKDKLVVFHAGTKFSNDEILTDNGGRVLCVASTGSTSKDALDNIYGSLENLDYKEGFYRKDIGS